jgi:DNA modification methylase
LEPAPGAIASARKGDIFLLGKHKVGCGSATDASLVQALFGSGASAQFVFTDEPYNVPIVGHVTGGVHREFEMASGEMSPAQYASFNETWMSAVLPYLEDGGVLATFIDWRGYPTVHTAATKLGLAPLNLIVWHKINAGMGSLYRSQYELLPMFKKGAGPVVNNVELGKRGRWRSNVWTYAGASSLGSDARRGLKEHPTVKPTAMLKDALLDLTNRGDVVFDPFLGSGSTLIAAESTQRICVGVEIDPLYVDLILRRYQEATRQSATLEATGESFAEVGERRAQETAQTPDVDAPARHDFEGRTSVQTLRQADGRSRVSEESSTIRPG